ncbi:hypothetical protein [Thermodesulfovibrio sp.]|uniref:hypothetical protein n=1 Tax=Thermodesulfovibrio sp. TaxID=2067987 RepID=UPI00261DE495|nr:hypothetical protein [Thermodesulfovibrio sp.]
MIEAGNLDIPKLTLESINISNGNCLKLKVSSCSFFCIYYTHYFADYIFSSSSNMENTKEENTLKNLIGRNVSKILLDNIVNFSKNKNFSLPSLLPNPLGITGIIQIGDKYIIRKRNKRVISEMDTYDWSFSGLIDSHDFLYEYYSGIKVIDILKIIEKEIIDELNLPIKFENLNDYIIGILPLGIVFNEKYLYQPELILYLNLKEKILNYLDFKELSIKLYSIEEIKINIFKEYEIGNKKIKNLFVISFELLNNFLKNK